MWPPPTREGCPTPPQWSRGSPHQRGMTTVRRRGVQGAGATGRSQWKAEGMGGISTLLNAEGLFAPLVPGWAVPELSWGNWAMESMKGKKWAITELVQSHSDGKDPRSKDQDWKARWGTPTANHEGKRQSHANNHPRITSRCSTGAIQKTCSFRKSSSLLVFWNMNT